MKPVATANSEISKILILVVKRVGEILLTTPAIRAFHKAFPDAQIDVVVDQPVQDVLEGIPYIHQLIRLDPERTPLKLVSAAIHLRKARYDITVDFLANPRTAFLSLIANAPVRIGLDKRIRKWAYNHYLCPSPEATSYVPDVRLNALRILGLDTDGTVLDFRISKEGREQGQQMLEDARIGASDSYVAVAPISLRAYKRWPPDHYAAVADHLIRERQCKVVLVGGPGEYRFLESTHEFMRERAAALLELRDLDSLAYILSQSALYIGNDSGIKHLASAVRVPTLTMFGPSNPAEWNEPDDPRHVVLWKEISCREPKCWQTCRYGYRCLELVTVDDAIQAADRLLAEAGTLKQQDTVRSVGTN